MIFKAAAIQMRSGVDTVKNAADMGARCVLLRLRALSMFRRRK